MNWCRKSRVAPDVLIELDRDLAPLGIDFDDEASTRPLGESITGLWEHVGIPGYGILVARLPQGVMGVADQCPALDVIVETIPDLEIPAVPELGLIPRDGDHTEFSPLTRLPDLTGVEAMNTFIRYRCQHHDFLRGPTKK